MIRNLFALSLGFAAFLFAASHAVAEPTHCGDRASVLARLADTYGETKRSIGMASDQAVMELFASDATGTWTMTITTAQGTMCMVASGQSFETLVGKAALGDGV